MLYRQKNGNPVCMATPHHAAEAVLAIPPMSERYFFWGGNGRHETCRCNFVSWVMSRKFRYDIPKPTWTCPHCRFVHAPADLLHLDSDRFQRKSCGESFASAPASEHPKTRRASVETITSGLSRGCLGHAGPDAIGSATAPSFGEAPCIIAAGY